MLSATKIAARCQRAVVCIRVFKRSKNGAYQDEGSGSGFFVKPRYLLTCAHVVHDMKRAWRKESSFKKRSPKAKRRYWVMFDGERRSFRAQLVGFDHARDLALLRVDGLPRCRYQILSFRYAKPMSGDMVYVAGFPGEGNRLSMSDGIVSGLNRCGEMQFLDSTIQTTAVVNPGNSGGPLLDARGCVLGVVDSSGGNGLGFAIPARFVDLSTVMKKGSKRYGYCGVKLAPLTFEPIPLNQTIDELRERLPRWKKPWLRRLISTFARIGVLVLGIKKGSPANKAGLKRGDIVTKFGKAWTNTNAEFRCAQLGSPIGKPVTLEVLRVRGKHPRRLKLTIVLI